MSRFIIIIKIVAFVWIVYLLSIIFPLQNYGIHPRETIGIVGIFTAPFLHGDIYHLTANTTSFLIFASILIIIERLLFSDILLHIMIIGGLSTWVLAREANHIGASGVIFGIFGYIVAVGFFRKKITLLIVSGIVIFVYGGMISQVLPSDPRVSWESHLFGFIAGIFTAKRFSSKTPKYKKKKIKKKSPKRKN